MKSTIKIECGKTYSLTDVTSVAWGRARVVISADALVVVKSNFDAVRNMGGEDETYGLTTGIADLVTEKPAGSPAEVQRNILLSHAVGTGPDLPDEVVRAAIFSRLLVFAKGYSGVSPELVTFMVDLLNSDIIPVSPSLGSIGASDLTIMAGIFVILCGTGQARYRGKLYPADEAFKLAKLTRPARLQTREGLALINGNDCAIATSALLLLRTRKHLDRSLKVAALAFEGRTGSSSSFGTESRLFKQFAGQVVTAKKLQAMLNGSKQIANAYANKNAKFLQDPPSFKTITHVIGNAWDVIERATDVVTLELNSITDNPIMITEKREARPVSSGNYACMQLATMLDQLALVTTQVAQASVARSQILLNDRYSEGLPKYLIVDSTNNSGFMICTYTAQSVLAEMRALLYPRSSFSSSVANGWEDVSSGAMGAALNTQKIIDLAEEALTIEMSLAIQAMSLRQQQPGAIYFGKSTEAIFARCSHSLKKSGINLPIHTDAGVHDYIHTMKKNLDLL